MAKGKVTYESSLSEARELVSRDVRPEDVLAAYELDLAIRGARNRMRSSRARKCLTDDSERLFRIVIMCVHGSNGSVSARSAAGVAVDAYLDGGLSVSHASDVIHDMYL